VTPNTHEVAAAHGRFVDKLQAGQLKVANNLNLHRFLGHLITRETV